MKHDNVSSVIFRLVFGIYWFALFVYYVVTLDEASKSQWWVILCLVVLALLSVVSIGVAFTSLQNMDLRNDVCKDCGHLLEEHRGGSGGDWWGSKYHSGECVNDAFSDGYYRVGGCRCYAFKKSFWPRQHLAKTIGVRTKAGRA